MTGLEIMEGLSYIDPKFIQEAETARLGRNVPWMKILSLAACVCILAVGALAYKQSFKGAAKDEAVSMMEQEPAADAPAMEPAAPAEEIFSDSATAEETEKTHELQHITAASLRILEFNEKGFTATVETESADVDFFTAGMQVQVIIDAGEVPGGVTGNSMYGGITLPEEGMVVHIENGAYDAASNVLYVTEIIISNREGDTQG